LVPIPGGAANANDYTVDGDNAGSHQTIRDYHFVLNAPAMMALTVHDMKVQGVHPEFFFGRPAVAEVPRRNVRGFW
jgi:hypothetical protein